MNHRGLGRRMGKRAFFCHRFFCHSSFPPKIESCLVGAQIIVKSVFDPCLIRGSVPSQLRRINRAQLVIFLPLPKSKKGTGPVKCACPLFRIHFFVLAGAAFPPQAVSTNIQGRKMRGRKIDDCASRAALVDRPFFCPLFFCLHSG